MRAYSTWFYPAVLLLLACAGAQPRSAQRSQSNTLPTRGAQAEEADNLVSDVDLEAVRRNFELKGRSVSRCFILGLKAGELSEDDRVRVTLGVTIQADGRVQQARIMDRSKLSKTLESCVIETATRWQFPSLPDTLQTSHSYDLQAF